MEKKNKKSKQIFIFQNILDLAVRCSHTKQMGEKKASTFQSQVGAILFNNFNVFKESLWSKWMCNRRKKTYILSFSTSDFWHYQKVMLLFLSTKLTFCILYNKKKKKKSSLLLMLARLFNIKRMFQFSWRWRAITEIKHFELNLSQMDKTFWGQESAAVRRLGP